MINEGISKFTFYLNLDEPRFMIINQILKFYIFHSKYMRFQLRIFNFKF